MRRLMPQAGTWVEHNGPRVSTAPLDHDASSKTGGANKAEFLNAEISQNSVHRRQTLNGEESQSRGMSFSISAGAAKS